MNSVSVCLITLNEEANLPRALESVEGLVEEMVVLDSGSVDRTQEIARQHGASVYVRAFTDYGDQRNYAASVAKHNWIFVLAPDEELSSELAEALRAWKEQEPRFPVYEMARLTFYLGGWVRHSRWYPDWQRRLYHREKARFAGTIHEALQFDGNPGRLKGDLLHYTVRNFAEHEAKVEHYSTLAARGMFERGKRSWRGPLWTATPWSWVRHFILGAGFLDGYRGARIAQMAARGVRLKYAKLGALVEAEKRAKQNGAG
jgi:glycosyltransferase involved in cell wall biosynthesis